MTPAPVLGGIRALRVVVLGGSSVLLAAGAHLTGGGQLPSATVLGVVGLVVGLMALTLTARRCRLPALLVVLSAQQLLLHQLFSASAPVATACGGPASHHTMGAGCWSNPMGVASMEPSSWSMVLGHGVATLVIAWLLARGETWCWRIVQQAVRAASAAPAPWPSAGARVQISASVPPWSGRDFIPAAPRGPPTHGWSAEGGA